MIFVDSSDNSFELTVVGYQFEGKNHNWYDDNWLNIKLSVIHPNGSWTCIDASLLTEEVSRLIIWLESGAVSASEENEIDFIEPNLRFELKKGAGTKLRVYFELESRPVWARADRAGMNDLWSEFEVLSRDLKAAADSLRRDLEKLPERRS